MKKLVLLLFTVFALNSCSVDDGQTGYHLEVLPIESFKVPQNFSMNAEYEITVTFKRPTGCYSFDGIYYEKSENTRIFGIQAKVYESTTCAPVEDEEPTEIKFNFLCTPGYQKYIFKFYKGQDAYGENVFEEVEIPVGY